MSKRNIEVQGNEGDKEEVPSSYEDSLWETRMVDNTADKPELKEAIVRYKKKREIRKAQEEVNKLFENPSDGNTKIIEQFEPGSIKERLFNERLAEEMKKYDNEHPETEKKKPWWKFWK